METPATSSSIQQLKKKYQVYTMECTGPKHRTAVSLDRHKTVLASFMRLRDISYRLVPLCISSPKQLEVSIQKVTSYSWQMIETLLECSYKAWEQSGLASGHN